MPEFCERGLPHYSGLQILRRLAAVRQAAKKARDPDMQKLWQNHAGYFLRQKGSTPKR